MTERASDMRNYKVGIVIPFYNGDDVIRPCLDSIIANDYQDIAVYLVNNSDKTTNIQAIAEIYKNVRVIHTNPRIGFARANNIGADLAISEECEIIISANQDLILDKDCIMELIKPFVSDPQIGVAAPISFTYDFKSINELFAKYCIADSPDMIYDALNYSLKDYYTVPEVHGACIAISAATIREIGFYDSLYFMYCEDTDLCRKMRYAKKKNVIASKAKTGHINSHLSEDPAGKRMRYRWIRTSTAIYTLKGLNHSICFNMMKVIRSILTDYIKAVLRLDIKELAIYFISDIKLILMLKGIFMSRAREGRIITSLTQ